MNERTYTLVFQSPVSVFSGLAVGGLVDRTVLRNNEGLPYVPGSSVKGRWRYVAERFLRTLSIRNATHGLSIHKENEARCKAPQDACTICRLFGNPSLPSMLWIGDAGLDKTLRDVIRCLLVQNQNPVVHPDTEIRPGIALSRIRRTTIENHLFFEEAVPPATFNGKLLVNGSLSEKEMAFAVATASLVDRIGGRKAVGRGVLRGGIKVSGGEKCASSA